MQNRDFSARRPRPPRAAQLRIIRIALGAGPLLLGAVALWRRGQNHGPAPTASLEMLRWAGYALCAASFGALFWFRAYRARRQPEERGTYSIIGWAIAEGTALCGGVVLLLGGVASPYLLGLLLMLVSWAWFPADPERIR